jgi:hypothetical protein
VACGSRPRPPATACPRSPSSSRARAQRSFFGADTLRIPELDEVPRRFMSLDLALLPVNGLRIRPAFNRQVVMTAEQAGQYCAVLRPKVAVPIHYAFTGGPVRDRLFLGYDGTPERFQRAVAQHAPPSPPGCWRLASPSPCTARALAHKARGRSARPCRTTGAQPAVRPDVRAARSDSAGRNLAGFVLPPKQTGSPACARVQPMVSSCRMQQILRT